MQDNVKAPLKNLLISFAVFTVSLLLLFLPSDSRTVTKLGLAPEKTFIKHVENGVTYYGERDFTVSYYTPDLTYGPPLSVTVTSETLPEVSIWVFYQTGMSMSNVFVPKVADGLGNATWSWRLPPNTSSEYIRIVLRSSKCYAELYIDLSIEN